MSTSKINTTILKRKGRWRNVLLATWCSKQETPRYGSSKWRLLRRKVKIPLEGKQKKIRLPFNFLNIPFVFLPIEPYNNAMMLRNDSAAWNQHNVSLDEVLKTNDLGSYKCSKFAAILFWAEVWFFGTDAKDKALVVVVSVDKDWSSLVDLCSFCVCWY